MTLSPLVALPLYIPLCIHNPPGQYHFPPPYQPLRIQIEGPLIAIQRLLPHATWHLGLLNQPFPQPAGPELARLTCQKIYGRDVCEDVPGDLVVRDEYLGWMSEKYPDQYVCFHYLSLSRSLSWRHLFPTINIADDSPPIVE